MIDFHKKHKILKDEFEDVLKKSFSNSSAPEEIIHAMEYSLFLDSKRLRPIIMMHLADVMNVSRNLIIPFCRAIEMIHTYSLIHDDLPAMDNDNIRRGKPSNHKVFGEDMAILAGDGLLNFAYEIMLNNIPKNNTNNYIKAMKYIAECAGISGMIGGQVLDIKNKANTEDELKQMHSLKTGKLFNASVMVVIILANTSKEEFVNYKKFSDNLGLLFQITDDILDVEGNEGNLGKSIGKDKRNKKTTYISVYSLNDAKRVAENVAKTCILYLKNTGYKEDYLNLLINYIKKREK